MKLPVHVIMQLLDAPFYCVQAALYPPQNFKHDTEVSTSNLLKTNNCHDTNLHKM